VGASNKDGVEKTSHFLASCTSKLEQDSRKLLLMINRKLHMRFRWHSKIDGHKLLQVQIFSECRVIFCRFGRQKQPNEWR